MSTCVFVCDLTLLTERLDLAPSVKMLSSLWGSDFCWEVLGSPEGFMLVPASLDIGAK